MAGRPTVTTILGELQSLDDSWAWAHAQLAGAPEDGRIGDRLGPSHGAGEPLPDRLSALAQPERPGRCGTWMAGLPGAGDRRRHAGSPRSRRRRSRAGLAARSRTARDANELDRACRCSTAWPFRTGPAGDFESLAELLVAVPAPYQVGRRVIDASRPRARIETMPARPGRGRTPPGDPGPARLAAHRSGRRTCPRTTSPGTPTGRHCSGSGWTTRTGIANQPGGVSAGPPAARRAGDLRALPPRPVAGEGRGPRSRRHVVRPAEPAAGATGSSPGSAHASSSATRSR